MAQRHDLCGMGIDRFGHVVFGGYASVELVQIYQPSIQGNFYVSGIKNCSGCVKINHLLDIEQ